MPAENGPIPSSAREGSRTQKSLTGPKIALATLQQTLEDFARVKPRDAIAAGVAAPVAIAGIPFAEQGIHEVATTSGLDRLDFSGKIFEGTIFAPRSAVQTASSEGSLLHATAFAQESPPTPEPQQEVLGASTSRADIVAKRISTEGVFSAETAHALASSEKFIAGAEYKSFDWKQFEGRTALSENGVLTIMTDKAMERLQVETGNAAPDEAARKTFAESAYATQNAALLPTEKVTAARGHDLIAFDSETGNVTRIDEQGNRTAVNVQWGYKNEEIWKVNATPSINIHGIYADENGLRSMLKLDDDGNWQVLEQNEYLLPGNANERMRKKLRLLIDTPQVDENGVAHRNPLQINETEANEFMQHMDEYGPTGSGKKEAKFNSFWAVYGEGGDPQMVIVVSGPNGSPYGFAPEYAANAMAAVDGTNGVNAGLVDKWGKIFGVSYIAAENPAKEIKKHTVSATFNNLGGIYVDVGEGPATWYPAEDFAVKISGESAGGWSYVRSNADGKLTPGMDIRHPIPVINKAMYSESIAQDYGAKLPIGWGEYIAQVSQDQIAQQKAKNGIS